MPGTLDAGYAVAGVSEFILEVVEGPDAGKRVAVDSQIVVGRDPAAGFVLEDQEVSRRHLQLTPTGDHVIVEDLGSANGTFVNRNELHGPARLDDGDELLAGVSVMQLRDQGQVQARHSAVITVPQGLAMAPRTPTYADPQKVAADVHGEDSGTPELERFLDVRVRRRAVNAPWLLAVLVALVLGAYFVTRGSSTAIANGPTAGWIYVEANTAAPNKNAVVAIPYTTTGVPLVGKATSYPTGGSGTPLVLPLPNSVGTTAGDHQVLLSPDHTLLFAVNQGSNSIAVFHVNTQTGALTPVSGSPFSSGGMAPIALGYSNGTLVVANHGIIAPYNLLGASPPGPSDLVSFKVSGAGALTKVSSTPPHPDGAIDANISPDGSTIVSTGVYPEVLPRPAVPDLRASADPLVHAVVHRGARPRRRSLVPAGLHRRAGRQGPAGDPEGAVPLAFGVAFNPDPTKKFVYVDAAVASRVAVYNYSNPASLQLASNAMNPGLAACWLVVSKDGRFLYDSNSATQNISEFSISSDGSTLKLIGTVPVKSKGTTDARSALDPSGKWLYILGNHDEADAPRPEGHPLTREYVDAYKVDPGTGKLSEIATVQLPVPVTNVPYGIDVLPKG